MPVFVRRLKFTRHLSKLLSVKFEAEIAELSWSLDVTLSERESPLLVPPSAIALDLQNYFLSLGIDGRLYPLNGLYPPERSDTASRRAIQFYTDDQPRDQGTSLERTSQGRKGEREGTRRTTISVELIVQQTCS